MAGARSSQAPSGDKEIVMCDNQQPQGHLVECKACDGKGKKGVLGSACDRCNGTGKQVIK